MAATREGMVAYEKRAEDAYTAMYDARPWNVKDHYEDACLYLNHAILIAQELGLDDEAERLKQRSQHIDAVYNHQFRYVGR